MSVVAVSLSLRPWRYDAKAALGLRCRLEGRDEGQTDPSYARRRYLAFSLTSWREILLLVIPGDGPSMLVCFQQQQRVPAWRGEDGSAGESVGSTWHGSGLPAWAGRLHPTTGLLFVHQQSKSMRVSIYSPCPAKHRFV